MVRRMRVLVSFAALLTLAACASAPAAPAASSTPSAAVATPQSSRAAQLLSRAGGASAPTQAEIERVFGPADIARQDGAGAALTYRFQTCGLLLLFRADARNDMRLAEAHPSPRSGGGAAPSLEQCAAEAPARGA
jgi:hypothetical protein